LIAVSVTMLSAGLATVVENPGRPLPFESAICLDGGLALYFVATGLIVLRYGGRIASVLTWISLGVILPLAAIVTIRWTDSLISILILAAVAIFTLTLTGLLFRRPPEGI
jgi:low temperature requirement protein LtrA